VFRLAVSAGATAVEHPRLLKTLRRGSEDSGQSEYGDVARDLSTGRLKPGVQERAIEVNAVVQQVLVAAAKIANVAALPGS
jgi:hypothetical protein